MKNKLPNIENLSRFELVQLDSEIKKNFYQKRRKLLSLELGLCLTLVASLITILVSIKLQNHLLIQSQIIMTFTQMYLWRFLI